MSTAPEEATSQTDRRGFLRLLGAALSFFSGRASANVSPEPRAPEIHRATRNTRLRALGARRPRLSSAPTPWKAYPDAPRLALPAVNAAVRGEALVDVVRGYQATRSFDGSALSLETLARLLHWTNGMTGRAGARLLRAAPSAGALYSGEVYLLVERVEGLDPGIYYYAVAQHELVTLRRGRFFEKVGRALEPTGWLDGAAACIALTNVFERYTWKYANRGYRYALIDTGHIGENLRLGTRASRLGEMRALRFEDDRLDALLDLGDGEAVCALHAIGAPADNVAASPVLTRLIEKQQASGWIGSGSGPLPARYHEATRLVPGRSGAASQASAVPASRQSGGSLSLPRLSQPPRAGVGSAIRSRRSAASFRSDPVSLEDLSFVLEMARHHDALEVAPGVDLYVAAHRVASLGPGLYRYLEDSHGLAAVAPGDLSGSMVRACLGQEKAGSAAVGFLMVGRFAHDASPLGGRSYRDLLVESGAVGQRIYLAAEAAGLAARNLAAFVDDDLNDLLGFDGVREAVLHLTMLGSES